MVSFRTTKLFRLSINESWFYSSIGNCFIESNINYQSYVSDDNFLEFYSKSKEQCCFDCNRLDICLSWSYDVENMTCTLKRSYRSNPTLAKNYFSGFKPNGLFSFAISKGLMFENVNNPIYSVLNKSFDSMSTNEKGLYDFLVLDLNTQVSLLF